MVASVPLGRQLWPEGMVELPATHTGLILRLADVLHFPSVVKGYTDVIEVRIPLVYKNATQDRRDVMYTLRGNVPHSLAWGELC